MRKEKSVPQIVSVRIIVEADPDYPLDDMLGSFSNQPKSEFAINHRRRQGRSNEFEWFNPAGADNRANAERDYLEMMEFVRDRKWMMRVAASAEISVPCGNGSVIGKAGPCYADGFDNEDNAGREEAEAQVKEELAKELRKLGFSGKEIADAIDRAETGEN